MNRSVVLAVIQDVRMRAHRGERCRADNVNVLALILVHGEEVAKGPDATEAPGSRS